MIVSQSSPEIEYQKMSLLAYASIEMMKGLLSSGSTVHHFSPEGSQKLATLAVMHATALIEEVRKAERGEGLPD